MVYVLLGKGVSPLRTEVGRGSKKAKKSAYVMLYVSLVY